MKNLSTIAATALIALFIPATTTGCAAQQSKPTPVETTVAPVEAVELGGPALWKVADEDTTIYLFGTVHALPKDLDWFDGAIEESLAASDSLVTEIYIKPGAEAQVQQAMIGKGTFGDGQTLRALLDDEQKATYEAAMAKLGMPAAAFDKLEPWLAGTTIGMLPLLKAGYSPDAGVEKVIGSKAEGKQRIQLESVDMQTDMFDQLPMDTQINYMMQAANGIDEIVPTINAIVEEWAEGDVEGVGVLLNKGFTDPVLAEKLLYERNANWAEWIDMRLDDPGTVFIAVGAGHLAGNKSVQDALKDRGIVTTRIK